MKSFKKFFNSICALLISGSLLYADILSAFPSEITMYTNEVHKSSLGALVVSATFVLSGVSSFPIELVTKMQKTRKIIENNIAFFMSYLFFRLTGARYSILLFNKNDSDSSLARSGRKLSLYSAFASQ